VEKAIGAALVQVGDPPVAAVEVFAEGLVRHSQHPAAGATVHRRYDHLPGGLLVSGSQPEDLTLAMTRKLAPPPACPLLVLEASVTGHEIARQLQYERPW
jgi:hypothetical protein